MTLKETEAEIKKIKDGQNEFLTMVKAEFKTINDKIEEFKTYHSNPILETKRELPNPDSTSNAIASGITQGTFPIPPEYQDIIKYSLNAKFKATIDYTPEGMMFTVIVPDKYSSLTDEQRKNIGGDLRTRVIPNHEGANGVKLWCDKVLGSFSTEIRSQIIMDRTN